MIERNRSTLHAIYTTDNSTPCRAAMTHTHTVTQDSNMSVIGQYSTLKRWIIPLSAVCLFASATVVHCLRYRVVQKKTVQSSMHHHFATAGYRVTWFSPKCLEI